MVLVWLTDFLFNKQVLHADVIVNIPVCCGWISEWGGGVCIGMESGWVPLPIPVPII